MGWEIAWWRDRERPPLPRRPAQPAGDGAGKYQLLYRYLSDRFANRVVLTFAEIEDLLGFSLPEPARLRQDWWDATAPPSTHTNAWTLARRTATVNMSAQAVVFERCEPPPVARRR